MSRAGAVGRRLCGSETTDGNTALGSNSATSRLFGTAAGPITGSRRLHWPALRWPAAARVFPSSMAASGRSDLFQAGAFVRHSDGPAYISVALAYGWQDVTTERTVTIAGVDRLRAEFNAEERRRRMRAAHPSRSAPVIAFAVRHEDGHGAANVPDVGPVVAPAGGFPKWHRSSRAADTRAPVAACSDNESFRPGPNGHRPSFSMGIPTTRPTAREVQRSLVSATSPWPLGLIA